MLATAAGRSESKPSTLRTDVQGLRAVAVGLVVAAHVFGKPSGGFIGVDVFFVISGFLITGLLVRERERTGRISIREFYARRARRILPMAMLVLLATNVAAHVIFRSGRAHQTFVDSLWSLGFLANIHFTAIGTSYFDALRPPSAVQHYWSLAVEEQFYVVWPALLTLAFVVARWLRRRSMTAVGVTAGLAVAASFVFCVHATHTDPTGSYFSPFTRAWELGIGALAAMVQPKVMGLAPRLRRWTGWTGVGLIMVSAVVITSKTPFPGTAALLPVLATALVLMSGPVAGGVGSRWALGNPVAMYLGQISYSLYLWHWPVLIFAKAYFGASGLKYYLVSTLGALALSAYSNWFVEEPFRHSRWLSRKPAGYAPDRRTLWEWISDNERPLIPLSIFVVVALLYAGNHVTGSGPSNAEALAADARAGLLTVPTSAGTPTTVSDLSPLEQTIKASLDATSWPPLQPSLDNLTHDAAPEWTKDNCINVERQNEVRCAYGPANAPHLAVVVGDSIAVSYMPGLRAALVDQGWRIQLLTKGECPMIDTPTKHTTDDTGEFKECTAHRSWAVSEVARLHPDLVISASAVAFVDRLVDGGKPNDPQNYALWQAGMQRMLAKLVPLAGRVVQLGAPPFTANLEACATRVSKPSDCTATVTPRWYSVQDAEKTAAEAANATYVDPVGWFCYQGGCPAVIGSTPVTWDGTHITATYSRTLGAPLRAALLPTL
ncbi:MAG TPA: acyltransferase family protein [Acidimicrobiales bacterium]|nr:acyltransferase family protein [Acidimicrobiales bacterium]